MLPAGLYESYCAKLARAASSNSCRYFDFSHSDVFTNDDFSDIVHLNNFGAKKMLSAILPDVRKSIDSLGAPASLPASSLPVKTAVTDLPH
jgi:hypothetical protein